MTAPGTELARRAEAVAAALRAATCGADVRIHLYPELGGASVESERGEAYVLPQADGFAMEAWHHSGREAYRTRRTDNLDAAITAAIEAVLTTAQQARITAATDHAEPQQGEEEQHGTPPATQS